MSCRKDLADNISSKQSCSTPSSLDYQPSNNVFSLPLSRGENVDYANLVDLMTKPKVTIH